MLTTILLRRIAARSAAAVAATAVVLAPGVASAQPLPAGATGQVPHAQRLPGTAVVADTSTPAPTTTTTGRAVTQGEGGDLRSGYFLGAVVLAALVAMGAWFLRTRRNRPQ
ncbi:hypothetical protein [Arsenicicoccus sp. oral taxon 190]|uniref:hypothetical protein n=1 Tax=Arsenicicoccus sp. oral taxon 190 TaxID=1658671 RepID=UPI00067A3B8B|nr:hypothetical protein [Arsenicicoccus sp. oral taxon 190]AKT50338.1 hypothetical protein ADJ73_01610 [Arsenicicoccus sp. oral taxon 190]